MAPPSVPEALALALRWPTFLLSIASLYWSAVYLGLTYNIQWLNFTKKRNDVLGWSTGLKNLHRFKVLKVGQRELYRHKPAMYLCNHRSWADFMVDQYVTEGRSLFMSRWGVVPVFPFFMTIMRAIRCVIIFKRGSIADVDGFNRWIDGQLAASPQSAIAVYPEGHRSTHGESLPLKRGMIKYAYSRGHPVQIVIGGNKEAILSEKHCTARLGQTVTVGFSEVLLPADYPDFEAFMVKVQETWDSEWNEVFSADFEGLPKLPEVPEPQFDYPLDIRVWMFFGVIVNFIAASWVARRMWRAACWVGALLGPLQWPAVALFVAYVAAAFYVYSQPVSALEVHKRMMRERLQSPTMAPPGAADGKKGQ